MEQKPIPLDQISISGGTQSRAATTDEAIVHYAEEMEAGTRFPPITVFFDGSAYWLADGFHRYLAAKKNEYSDIAAEIREGGRTAALEHALGANATNGLFRTNDDKRHAVEIALEEWPEKANTVLADVCKVSVEFVRRRRKQLDVPPPATVTGKDGKQYPARVERQPRGESGNGEGSGGGGRPSKKNAAADMPFGGSSKDMEIAAMDMERKGEISFLRPGDPMPNSAMGLARMAIAALGQIKETDPEREKALATVRDWMEKNAPVTDPKEAAVPSQNGTSSGA